MQIGDRPRAGVTAPACLVSWSGNQEPGAMDNRAPFSQAAYSVTCPAVRP